MEKISFGEHSVIPANRNDPCPCGSGRKAKNCTHPPGENFGADAPIQLAMKDGTVKCLSFNDAVNLAKQFHKQGDLDFAEKAYRLALAVQPENPDVVFFLGLLLYDRGAQAEALELMQRAIALKPDVAGYRYNLGTIFHSAGRSDEAEAAYRSAIALDPAQSGSHNNLGLVLQELGRQDEALSCFKQAINLMPSESAAPVLTNMANSLQKLGRPREALEQYAMAMSLSPQNTVANSNYLFALNYQANPDRAAIFEAHRKFGEKFERTVKRLPPRNAAKEPLGPARPLRVGYVSCDFRSNPVAHFIEPVLKHHDKSRFEIFCYSNHTIVDEVTTRIRKLADHWRDITNLGDDDAARMIRDDGIDILIDLTGHAGNDRLMVFARKPAPVQATWIGYPNTTGLRSIDYRITDTVSDPIGVTDDLYTEKLVRLPDTFSCFQPLANSPDVGVLPATQSDHITFGSFNNFIKMTPEVLQTWARILQRVPTAKLILKYASFQEEKICALVLAEFAKHGVAHERLVLLGNDASQYDHLARYNKIDIALDPFPYNGTTTTCDALWMGVPIIALAGKTHVSRVGVSQLTNIGLPELIAADKDAYVEVAVALASDLPRLAQLRSGLRQRMHISPLMDAPRFTKNLEDAFDLIWKKYVAEPGA